MNRLVIWLIPVLVWCLTFSAKGQQSTGLCLHAYGPTAPPEKVQAFEYTRVEKVQGGQRFFVKPRGTTTVTDYRLRVTISYPKDLSPANPELPNLLATYEEQAGKFPATRPYLNPWIERIRAVLSAEEERKKQMDSKPRLVIGKQAYLSPTFSAFEDGKLVLKHHAGVERIPVEELPDDFGTLLAEADPKAPPVTTVTLASGRLFNPAFVKIEKGEVVIRHAAGELRAPLNRIPASDRIVINSWSDGSWMVSEPGFKGRSSDSGDYRELVTAAGRKYERVRLLERDGDSVVFGSVKGPVKVDMAEMPAGLAGLDAGDKAKVESMIGEVVRERSKRAKEVELRKVLKSFPGQDEESAYRFVDVAAVIGQVVEGGVLVNGFIGERITGTNDVEITRCKTFPHPVTGEEVKEVLSMKTGVELTTQRFVEERQCFIACDPKDAVDGEGIRLKSMERNGSFTFVSAAGARRTIPGFEYRGAHKMPEDPR